MTDESDEILSRVEDGVGFATLNRPKAINSLNQGMVDELRAVLAGWEQDSEVHAVVLAGAGERGLCAGGDVVAIYHSARADGVAARRFWRDEYLLNGQIGRFPKTCRAWSKTRYISSTVCGRNALRTSGRLNATRTVASLTWR